MSRYLWFTAIILCSLSAIQAYGQAQSLTSKHHTTHKSHNLAIGFQTGAQTMFTPTINSPHLFDNHKYNFTKGAYVKKYWGNYFGLEASINYTSIPHIDISQNRNIPNTTSAFNSQDKIYTITIPVVIQYYIFPKTCKFRPYIGAGAAYNKSNLFNTNIQAEDLLNPPPSSFHCNSYVSIAVVQGITYEVNTKIQFNESLHFEPSSNGNIFGLSLGIGYKL